jgi:hypothetical protein
MLYPPPVVRHQPLGQHGGKGEDHKGMPVSVEIMLPEIIQRFQDRHGQLHRGHDIQDIRGIIRVGKNGFIGRAGKKLQNVFLYSSALHQRHTLCCRRAVGGNNLTDHFLRQSNPCRHQFLAFKSMNGMLQEYFIHGYLPGITFLIAMACNK